MLRLLNTYSIEDAFSQGEGSDNPAGSPALPNTGALVEVKRDGTFTVVTDALDRPTSLEFVGDTAYVVTLIGEVWRITASRVREHRIEVEVRSPPFPEAGEKTAPPTGMRSVDLYRVSLGYVSAEPGLTCTPMSFAHSFIDSCVSSRVEAGKKYTILRSG